MSENKELPEAWSDGSADAVHRLLPMVYAELRRSAERAMAGRRASITLQPTALVHEAFLRLVGRDQAHWANRGHFLAVAASAMRQILVDHARARAAEKRGGGLTRVTLGDELASQARTDVDLLSLDQALARLSAFDTRSARVVELRYFGGLTDAETAEALGTSVATVKRDWTAARAWLRRELGSTA